MSATTGVDSLTLVEGKDIVTCDRLCFKLRQLVKYVELELSISIAYSAMTYRSQLHFREGSSRLARGIGEKEPHGASDLPQGFRSMLDGVWSDRDISGVVDRCGPYSQSVCALSRFLLYISHVWGLDSLLFPW
jgi:hypothetical protein